MGQRRTSASPSYQPGHSPIDRANRDEAEDIAIFGGKTRLVSSSGNSSPGLRKSQSPPILPDLSHWRDPNTVPILPSLSGYRIQQPTSVGQVPAAHSPAGPSHQQWNLPEFTDPQFLPTSSAGPEPVDFILDDSWSTFLQNYGALPPPRQT